MRKPFSLVDLAIVLALAIVGVVGYKYSPLLLAEADLTIEAADCNLNAQSCRVGLPDGAYLELSLSPQPMPVMRPIAVNALLSGLTAQSVEKVEIDFAGASMNMGYNRKTLTAAGDGRFVGEAMIPVCTTGRMTWRATLIVQTRRQRIAAAFLFDAPTR